MTDDTLPPSALPSAPAIADTAAAHAVAEVRRTGRDRLGITARHPWHIPLAGWWAVLRRTATEVGRDNVSLLAAGVAFYVFLAFVPLLASIVLLYGLIADPADVARHIGALVTQLPADAATIIADQLTAVTTAAPSRTGLGLLTAVALSIYGATKGAGSIIAATNIAYEQAEQRSFLRVTGLSFAMTLGAVALGIALTVALSAITVLGRAIVLPDGLTSAIRAGSWALTATIFAGLLATIYRYGPDRHNARWTWLVPGAAVASIGCIAGTAAFGFYVSRWGSYNATYGALGTVVSFLMWLYVTAYVVLVGAELNAELERQTARDTTEGPETPLGTRRAVMADTVVAGTEAPPENAREAQEAQGSATGPGQDAGDRHA